MNAKGKGGEKAAGSNPRAKATNWPPAISEFLLDWYIEKKLAMPPKTFFKKMHHTACTSAVNSKYGTTYTVEQVHRHWRRHKDTWGLVAKHMNESGGGWDYDTKMVTLSKSTLNELSVIISCLSSHLTCIIINDSYCFLCKQMTVGFCLNQFSSLTSCKNYLVAAQLMVLLCKTLPLQLIQTKMILRDLTC